MASLLCNAVRPAGAQQDAATALPEGVKAVWDVEKAYREGTPTRERMCINGLWRWQPAAQLSEAVPTGNWGYFKVPGPWSGSGQTIYAHPSWTGQSANATEVAWYQREVTIPANWQGRRIALYAEYINSYAAVYLDGKKVGDLYFPWGELDVTSACRPGAAQVLSLCVQAAPLAAVMQAYTDTGAPRRVRGTVERRGLCGDVFLVSTPRGARVGDVKVNTSVRKWQIELDTSLQDLEEGRSYSLRAQVTDEGRPVKELSSRPLTAADLNDGRFSFASDWQPDKLWDVHTPGNMYEVKLSLLDANGQVLDESRPVRFGFREFWVDKRDFYLNGTRFYSFIVPFDNAQLSVGSATYDACRETMLRDMSYGVNAVYTHNYGCQPGAHLSFGEFLKAADDVGMLVALSQPHYGQYAWDAPDAEKTNGYARHAEFYVRMAQNHPSVVMYSTSHNSLMYEGCHDPDLMDGLHNERGTIGPRADRGAGQALRAQAILERLDPSRVVYHHSSGNLGTMYTLNFYLDFVPIQERSDWFEHWATEGVKPLLLCEYGAPWGINWTMYRGWYKGVRSWGSARLPWELCEGEWNAQFLGDSAFNLSELDKANLRWETQQWRAGREWYKWDYPYQPSAYYSYGHDDKERVWKMYITDNWRAFRTWGVSGFNVWGPSVFWKLREGVKLARQKANVAWEDLQRPGYSPDFVEPSGPCFEFAGQRSDWVPTAAAEALFRNNMPLLAYIAGKPEHFTAKEHNFLPGQTIRKQLIVINNSRQAVTCNCSWSLALPQPVRGSKEVTVATGNQERVPLEFALPADLKPGAYELSMTARFSSGQTQEDAVQVHVLPPTPPVRAAARVALFDPKGETAQLLTALGVQAQPVQAGSDLSPYQLLVVGKAALTADGAAPDISRVRDGLRVVMFEQASDVLEKRFGFRVQEYGLRHLFTRVPDHPILEGLSTENLHDWGGQATIMPPRLTNYTTRPRYGATIEWCGIPATRPYRAGNWGNVASVLIEKPARGNFLPIVDGGFSLQFSPLMEYREGTGLVLLCQMDVTGRTAEEPAATRLVANILNYASAYVPPPPRQVVYAGQEAGRRHLEQAGLSVAAYEGGPLGDGQVLVVGPGGGEVLAPRADAVRQWARQGGNILAIGLGQQEANAFLPFAVQTKQAEHICAVFSPPGMGSLLAGVGPADVLNRDPRQTDLVSGGADAIGDGILAVGKESKVVFCQLAPWEFDYQKYYNLKRTFRRLSCLVTRVLGNMGASAPTPLIERFASPVRPDAGEARWAEGFYLDQPQEFDDPYRYFMW